MLHIRKQQMDSMRDALKQTYVPRLLTFMHEENPEAVAEATEEECHELIQDCIDKAGEYGLHDLYEVQQFLQCMLWLGTDFDSRHEWAQTILQDSDLSSDEKADALEDGALDYWSKGGD